MGCRGDVVAEATVLVIQGVDQGLRFRIGERPVTIGRGARNQIRIVDTEVSRKHAIVQPSDGGFELIDADSSNGTFVNANPVTTPSSDTFADGVACRVPEPEAVEIICRGAERVVTVSEAEIAAAVRHYFTDTHNPAEGAGSAPLAALLKERECMAAKRVGLILTGGNIDRALYQEMLAQA